MAKQRGREGGADTEVAARLDRVLSEHGGENAATTGKAMTSGVRWMAPTQIAVQVVRVGSVFVLTRLLDPAEFGIVALVTVITGLFERVLGDTGTTTALVRIKQLNQGLASSVFFWNVLVGALSTAALVLFGAPIASALGDAEATDIVRVMAFLALVNSLAYVPYALFRRHLLFQRLAVVNLTNAVVTALATIGFAFAGLGAWALVWGNLLGSAAATLLAWTLTAWRPSMHFSRNRLREISKFSSNLTAQNVFGYISYAGDRFIVGRFVGTTALGYYGLANRLMRYPVQTTSQTYREAVFPSLARIQDDPVAMTKAYQRSVSGIALLVFPLCAVVAALSDPLVAFALGPKWIPAADVLAIVAATSGLQAVASTTGSLYNARGRADLSLRWQVFSSIFLLTSYAIGSRWGLVGVAWSYLIGIALLSPAAFIIPLRLIGARASVVMRSAVALGVAAIVAGFAGHAVAAWVAGHQGSDFVQVVTGAATVLVLYVAYLLIARPQAARDLLRLARRA